MSGATDFIELSPQEQQVLLSAISGLGDKQIALRLQISVDTVKTYWKRIRAKMGNLTRATIVAQFAENRAAVALTMAHALQDDLQAEIKRQQDELAIFRVIAESIPLAVFVLDSRQDGVYANPAWLALTRLSFGDAMKRGWRAAVKAQDCAHLIQQIETAMVTENDAVVEHRLAPERATGSPAIAIFRTIRMHNRLIGWLYILTAFEPDPAGVLLTDATPPSAFESSANFQDTVTVRADMLESLDRFPKN